jgi:HAD superfamily hydrolase (TIGR01549 family)
VSADQQEVFSRVRLFLFDLDGTLLLNSPSNLDIVLSAAAAYGIYPDPQYQRRAVRWGHAYWADQRQIHEDTERFPEHFDFFCDYYVRYLQAMNVFHEDLERIASRAAQEYIRGLDNSTTRLAEGARDVLFTLRTHGYILGLVSNRQEPLTGIALEFGIIEFFDFTLSAGQIGYPKPHPAIFLKALEMAGNVAPEEAVYVGDNYYADILGAEGAGITGILVDHHQAFDEPGHDCIKLTELAGLAKLIPS